MCYKKRIMLFESFYGLSGLKNGTEGVELHKKISSPIEHMCYLFPLTLEHVHYLSWVMDGWIYI
jgi:hypothetical protein